VQFVFEAADRGGQRRLGDKAGGRRAGEVALAGEGDQVFQLAQLHT
jgi:hypothetical protein